MNQKIQGITVRDNYPDYPQDLKDWELWQLRENHEIGIRKALISCGSMNSKFHIMSWKGKISQAAIEKEGHSTLDLLNCSCYTNWLKARADKLLPFVISGKPYPR